MTFDAPAPFVRIASRLYQQHRRWHAFICAM